MKIVSFVKNKKEEFMRDTSPLLPIKAFGDVVDYEKG